MNSELCCSPSWASCQCASMFVYVGVGRVGVGVGVLVVHLPPSSSTSTHLNFTSTSTLPTPTLSSLPSLPSLLYLIYLPPTLLVISSFSPCSPSRCVRAPIASFDSFAFAFALPCPALIWFLAYSWLIPGIPYSWPVPCGGPCFALYLVLGLFPSSPLFSCRAFNSFLQSSSCSLPLPSTSIAWLPQFDLHDHSKV